jgi:4-hydroxy-3-polyprenylbenzoate decarboxylase
MYPSLRAFLSALDADGQLLRVRAPIDPVLDVAALADLESKARAPGRPSEAATRADPAHWDRGGRALLCERVTGADIPLVINAFGSYRRMEMALGCHDEGHTPGGFAAIADRISRLTKPVPPRTLGELYTRGREFLPLLSVMPRMVGSAPCQELVLQGDDVDLTTLPIPRCWPHDGDLAALGYPADVNAGVRGLGHPQLDPATWDARFRGRYITFAGIHTIHRDDLGQERPASHNIGMYRVQLMGRRAVAMHWHMHHDGARHWRSWRKAGERMPVAIVLGGESVLPYAATCPLPPGIAELLMAGFLNRGGIPMVWCRTVPLRVPANAELVIEGWVDPRAGFPGWDPREEGAGPLGDGAVFEGPFGDHTGFYSMPDRYPLVQVTALTRRRDALFPATLVGLPPQEDYYLGKATERVMGALLKVIIHDIVDYDLPMFGAFHNCAALQIHKDYPLQGRRVMHSVWGAGQMAWTKCLFVVDDDVDVHDADAVLDAAAARCHPARDIEQVRGPLDILDHAAPRFGAGGKIGFDCTRKMPGDAVDERPFDEGVGPLAADGPWVDALRAATGALEARLARPGWLLLRADQGHADPDHAGEDDRVLQAALEQPAPGAVPFIVVLGRDVDLADPVAPFFHWLANMDPTRDLRRSADGQRVGFACAPKTAADARHGQPVRAWPPVLTHDPAALARAEAHR